jgi:hypothetical protein
MDGTQNLLSNLTSGGLFETLLSKTEGFEHSPETLYAFTASLSSSADTGERDSPPPTEPGPGCNFFGDFFDLAQNPGEDLDWPITDSEFADGDIPTNFYITADEPLMSIEELDQILDTDTTHEQRASNPPPSDTGGSDDHGISDQPDDVIFLSSTSRRPNKFLDSNGELIFPSLGDLMNMSLEDHKELWGFHDRL